MAGCSIMRVIIDVDYSYATEIEGECVFIAYKYLKKTLDFN